MAIIYKNTPQFSKLFKKLAKKYKTLPEDFERLKKSSISLFHNPNTHFDNQGIIKIPGFAHPNISIYKIRKFSSRSLKGGAMSGLRVIYAYHSNKNLIEFIEIYYKGNQANHSRDVIKKYLNQ